MKPREKLEGFAGQRLVVVPRPILATALQHPLLSQFVPTDAGVYPKAAGHICERKDGAAEVIFIYCAEGKGWCEIEGRRHEIGSNQLLVINPKTPHKYGAAGNSPWTIYWFHAVGANIPHYLERLEVSPAKPIVSLWGDVQLYQLFEDLLEGLQRGFTLTHLIYAAHSLSHLMGLILRHKEDYWHDQSSTRERILRSIDYMKAHLREPLNVASLARMANLSRSHYTTLFHRATGYGPLSYLNHLRLQRAVELLISTNWPIKHISEQLGFSDQFYFSRAFAKMHSHSPSEHRTRYKT